MNKLKLMYLSLLSLLTCVLLSQSVSIADTGVNVRADISNGKTIYDEGKGDAMACGACHGENALGMDATESPRMANIGQIYLIKQLDDYAANKRVDPGAGEMMNDIAKALSKQDRIDVAAYLDSLTYITESSNLKELSSEGIKVGSPKRGKTIMNEGIKPLIPACKDCHGISGRATNIAALHQQKYIYLVNQLNRYRDGSRNNDQKVDTDGIMRGIAKTLTSQNIADVAAYLSTFNSMDP